MSLTPFWILIHTFSFNSYEKLTDASTRKRIIYYIRSSVKLTIIGQYAINVFKNFLALKKRGFSISYLIPIRNVHLDSQVLINLINQFLLRYFLFNEQIRKKSKITNKEPLSEIFFLIRAAWCSIN